MFKVIGANIGTLVLIGIFVFIFAAVLLDKVINFIKSYIIEPLVEEVKKLFDKIVDEVKNIIPSDERLKENIIFLGKTDSDENINVYKYNYIHDEDKKQYIGLLAQELEIYPEYKDCLSSDQSGLLKINYNKLGLKYHDKDLPFEEE